MNPGVFSTLLPLAVASGVNLYATILVIGLSIRMGWVRDIPAGLEIFATWPVLIVAGVFYALEFLADKIQFIDNLWDAVHTFVRPLGAAVIGTEVFAGASPEIRTAAALLAGSIALTSHSGKAGSRVALNIASPAENVSNIAISLAEDLAVGALVLFALNYPLVAAIIAIIVLAAILVFAPRLIRWAWFLVRAIKARVSGLFHPYSQSDLLPTDHAERVPGGAPQLSAISTGQGLHGSTSRAGYLSLLNQGLFFTYDTWFRKRSWQLPLEQIAETRLLPHALMDVLEVAYRDDAGRPQTARFLFLKDRASLARQFAEKLTAATRSHPAA